MKARKKPVEVDVWQVPSRYAEPPAWFYEGGGFYDRQGFGIYVGDARVRARAGDYIIRHPEGTLASCAQQNFSARYEPV